jgi:hypothetical protein
LDRKIARLIKENVHLVARVNKLEEGMVQHPEAFPLDLSPSDHACPRISNAEAHG